MTAQEQEERQEDMPDNSGTSGRSPNPNRQPGGGGAGNGGETTRYINTGISKEENPNAELKEKLSPN